MALEEALAQVLFVVAAASAVASAAASAVALAMLAKVGKVELAGLPGDLVGPSSSSWVAAAVLLLLVVGTGIGLAEFQPAWMGRAVPQELPVVAVP